MLITVIGNYKKDNNESNSNRHWQYRRDNNQLQANRKSHIWQYGSLKEEKYESIKIKIHSFRKFGCKRLF